MFQATYSEDLTSMVEVYFGLKFILFSKFLLNFWGSFFPQLIFHRSLSINIVFFTFVLIPGCSNFEIESKNIQHTPLKEKIICNCSFA